MNLVLLRMTLSFVVLSGSTTMLLYAADEEKSFIWPDSSEIGDFCEEDEEVVRCARVETSMLCCAEDEEGAYEKVELFPVTLQDGISFHVLDRDYETVVRAFERYAMEREELRALCDELQRRLHALSLKKNKRRFGIHEAVRQSMKFGIIGGLTEEGAYA